MGIIKRADIESYTRGAVPIDLGDLHRRGEAVIKAAQDEAESILKAAQQQRDQLVGNAEEDGNSKGYQAGLAKGIEEGTAQGIEQATQQHAERLDELQRNWEASLAKWETDRCELMTAARTEVIELAAHIAARVIRRTIDLDPEIVVDQLDAVLETLVKPTDIRVCVHPSDRALIERVMPSMIERCSACKHAELVEDDALAPGSCVVRTKGGGTIDASIEKQFDRVVATLLPAHRGPEYDRHLDEPEAPTNSQDDAA